MAKRIHLGQIDETVGTIWFTLIYESPSDFFVERYNDSDLPFLSERLKQIKPKDFDRYEVNGVPLKKLVEAKLEELRDRESKLILQGGGGKIKAFCPDATS